MKKKTQQEIEKLGKMVLDRDGIIAAQKRVIRRRENWLEENVARVGRLERSLDEAVALNGRLKSDFDAAVAFATELTDRALNAIEALAPGATEKAAEAERAANPVHTVSPEDFNWTQPKPEYGQFKVLRTGSVVEGELPLRKPTFERRMRVGDQMVEFTFTVSPPGQLLS